MVDTQLPRGVLPAADPRHQAKLSAQDMDDWGKESCTMTDLASVDDLYNYIDNPQLHCDRPVMVGGQLKTHPPYMIGEKWVCMSKQYNIVPGDCIALSFGIDKDYSFDDDLGLRFNCKVYSFDPTIGQESHTRSPNVMFYDLGISSYDTTIGKLKMARYITILEMLGLENTTIDYLKMDVEGDELNFFHDIFTNTPNLLKNIKQIGVEIHYQHTDPGRTIKREKLWRYFQLLECFGFKLMFSEASPIEVQKFLFRGEVRTCCYELVWARDLQW
ncbi:uncharacterized protein [Panulirus ornatus]|uniref:uncharacterized protein n=1 Tax=Panulirus ornatus TaxID=150431 RepID=UPI003A84CA6B